MTKTRRNNLPKNKTCKINYIPSADKDIKAIIDVNAIRNNVKFLKKKTGTDIMPVLKADAYGHGLIEMAKVLRTIGVKYIGVATLGVATLGVATLGVAARGVDTLGVVFLLDAL